MAQLQRSVDNYAWYSNQSYYHHSPSPQPSYPSTTIHGSTLSSVHNPYYPSPPQSYTLSSAYNTFHQPPINYSHLLPPAAGLPSPMACLSSSQLPTYYSQHPSQLQQHHHQYIPQVDSRLKEVKISSQPLPKDHKIVTHQLFDQMSVSKCKNPREMLPKSFVDNDDDESLQNESIDQLQIKKDYGCMLGYNRKREDLLRLEQKKESGNEKVLEAKLIVEATPSESAKSDVAASSSTQPLSKEDLGWGEIEDMSSIDGNEVTRFGSSLNILVLCKLSSAAEDDEESSEKDVEEATKEFLKLKLECKDCTGSGNVNEIVKDEVISSIFEAKVSTQDEVKSANSVSEVSNVGLKTDTDSQENDEFVDETDPAIWRKLEAAIDEYIQSNSQVFKNACERLTLPFLNAEKWCENLKPRFMSGKLPNSRVHYWTVEGSPSLGWRRNVLLVEAQHNTDSGRVMHHARALESFCSNNGIKLSSFKILGEDVIISQDNSQEKSDVKLIDSSRDRVDHYIRASIKNASSKGVENRKKETAEIEGEVVGKTWLRLAKEVEELGLHERECFSPIFKRCHLLAAGVASVSLHQCYGSMLMQYLAGRTCVTKDTVEVLQIASKLEKFIVQMVAEESEEYEDGGKGLVIEMVPYEVESIILQLLRKWIEEKLRIIQESLSRAKEAETWNPKSKSEPYGQSASDLMKLANEVIGEFFEIPIDITKDLVYDQHYIHLNTLHFLSSQLQSLNKALSLNPRVLPATRIKSSSYLDFTQARNKSACQHVSKVATYHLILLDLNSVFYESLHVGDVANARIKHALRITEQQLTLMSAILADRVQALAMKEVMKASFEVVLMVLLANGHFRVCYRMDHKMIKEYFGSSTSKKVYCICDEGLISEEVVDSEAETVEGVIQFMGQSTEQLMEDISQNNDYEEQLLMQVQAQNEEFSNIFNLKDYKAPKEKCSKLIPAALIKHREIKENINEGIKFYVTLQNAITNVKQECNNEIMTMIAMIQIVNIFYRPREKQAQADLIINS